MKPLLTALLGAWFLAAPALCEAACWAPTTGEEAVADAPMQSCHHASEDEADTTSNEPAPARGEDCCHDHGQPEIGPQPADLASPHAPVLTLAALVEAAPTTTARLALAPHSRDGPGDALRSPYRRENPPLLN